MRRLFTAFLLLLFLSVLPAGAQDNADEKSAMHEQHKKEQQAKLERLQTTVDSLHTLKNQLTRHLNSVELQMRDAEALLHLHRMEQMDDESVVLMTNMEASLRTRPSPDGRVIRILPGKTPLIAADFNGAYWKVRYQGIEGWVMRLFVDEGPEAALLKQKFQADENASPRPGTLTGKLAAERIGKDFLVTDFGIHPPNSAGGVSIYYAFEHLDSTRTVREVTFSITPFNADGAKEKGLNSGASTKRLRRFGPITVHDGERQYQFENVWYNSAISCAQIDRVDIVYTDGSRVSHRQDLAPVLSSSIPNDCTITTAEERELKN